MAVELATAYVQLVPSAQGIKAGIARELALDDVARTAGASAGKSLGRSLVTGATAALAGLAVGKFFKASFDQAQEAQKVGAQTEAVIKSTGGAAQVSAGQINDLANSLSKKAGIDDEVIQSGENVLLTFRQVRNEAGKGNDIFTQASKAALDLSVALGGDLKNANIQVGKALADPIKGLTNLRRVGVIFTESQKEQIKTLVESGNLLGAQKIILRELATEFGGSAAAQATAADKASVAIKNLEESVGVALMPAFNTAAHAISFFTDLLNDLPGPVRDIVVDVGLLGAGLVAAAVIASKFGGAFTIISTGAKVAGEAIAGLTSLLEGFTAAEIAAAAGPVLLFVGAVALIAAAIAGVGFAIDAVFNTDTTGRGSFGQVLDALDKGKQEGADWAKNIVAGAKGSADPLNTLRGSLALLRIEQAATGVAFKQGKLSEQEAAEASTKYAAAIGATKGAITQLKVQQVEADAATKAAAQGLQTYTIALGFGATQTQALAAAGDKGREAIQNLQNVLLATAGGAVGYAQATANLAKAQNDYNTAVETFGVNSPEAQAAQLNLNQAQLASVQAAQSADKAQQDLVDGLVDGTSSYEDLARQLFAQIQLHPENAAGIQLEVNKLNDAKAAADAIPGSKSTKVTADTSQFMAALGEVFGALAQLDQKIPGVKLALDLLAVAPHATGGIFTTPQVGLIAEAGPEAIIPLKNPDRALSILAQTGLFATAVPAQAGGGGLVIQNATFGDRDVITDLDYWARTQAVGV